MYSAIITKYLRPTNTRGGRIKATANGIPASLTVAYDYELGPIGSHKKAAEQFAREHQWQGDWTGGHAANGYVWARSCSSTVSSFSIAEEV